MAEIRDGVFTRNETNKNSMGGTERLTMELANRLDKDLLKDFQIVSSRVRDLQEDKIRIFYAHDLPGDPESDFLKQKSNQDKFHLYVFVSEWQMQGYITYYDLPWSKCIVIKNSIDPIEQHDKPNDGTINFIYTSTPHRGLNILYSVFDKLCEKYDNIFLNVYSSFKIYGWGDRDEQFKDLFDMIEKHPKMKNHGTVDNSVIREALKESHVFAYPSIWQETSCLSLIEAMSAGCVCIHPNYGALFETSYQTMMYQYNEDLNEHATQFYNITSNLLENWGSISPEQISITRTHANINYSWDSNINTWRYLLMYLRSKITNTSIPYERFQYRTG